MSTSNRPTLIVAHGGWHDPTCFDLVRKPLESKGFNVHVPQLPSIGKLAATKTSDDDVKLIHDLAEECLSNGEDVIVLGHSNGGFKANGALEGLVGPGVKEVDGRGKVLGIALIAAFIPPAMVKGAFKDVPPMDTDWWVVNDTEPTFLPIDPSRLFYNDMPADHAAYWTSRIVPMRIPDLPLNFYEAWRHVPTSYLACLDDQAMPLETQKALVKAAKAEGGVVYWTEVESGHSPFLSVPKKVVEWVERAVAEELVRERL